MMCSLMTNLLNGQSNDYTIYHDYINKAETFYFLNNNVDSCFYYYDKAFEEFDFVFVKDVANSVQLACYHKRAFNHYLYKGFENGLKLTHFQDIPVMAEVYPQLINDKELKKKYEEKRKKYIETINFDYLLQIYDMYLRDQVYKNIGGPEYERIQEKDMIDLKAWTKQKGFPGEKVLGIADQKIFSEKGLSDFDLNNRSNNKFKRNFNIQEEFLYSPYVFYVMYHNPCTYQLWQNYWRELIKKGEVHPRTVGVLYDTIFDRHKPFNCSKGSPYKGLFLLDPFCDYKRLPWNEESVNKIRAEWQIVPLSVDRKMAEYEKCLGFKLRWGFGGHL